MKHDFPTRSFLWGAATGFTVATALRPASTPPVLHQNAGSISALEAVEINGSTQWVLQRGVDRTKPILLYIHGGPGISEMVFNRKHSEALEQHFVVVNWDQRGAGKSYKALEQESDMNIPQFIADIKAVTEWLLTKFGRQRLTLLGRSWGSAIGLQAVALYPHLFEAYVGVGQLTDVLQSEQAAYHWTLQEAKRRKDHKAIAELSEMGDPPYSGDWLDKFITQRKYVCRYGGEFVGNPHGSNLLLAQSVLFGPEYSLADKLHYYHCTKTSLRLLQPQLMKLNLSESAAEVSVPLFFMAGRQDQVVPQQVARQYFESVKAAQKHWYWFDNSAHMPDVEEKEKFTRLMLQEVLPLST